MEDEDAITIPLTLQLVDQGRAADTATRKVAQLNQQVQQYQKTLRDINTGSQRMAPPADATRMARYTPSFSAGPMARLQRAQTQAAVAQNIGTQAQQFDARHNLQQARAVASKARQDPNATRQVVVTPAPLPPGPAQRVQQAQQQVRQAQATGTSAQQFDAKLRFQQAQAALAKAQTPPAPPKPDPSWGQQFARVLTSSRFGVAPGGGINLLPLVGQTAKLFGAAGPFAIGVGVAVTALMAFRDAVQGAARAAGSLADIHFQTGATPIETARLDVLGAAVGVKGGEAAGAASQFAKTLGTNPLAMRAFGMQDILSPMGLGKLDQAGQFLKGIGKLLDMTEEQAQRAIRQAPELAPFMKLRYADPEHLKRIMDTASAQNRLVGPEQQRNLINMGIDTAMAGKTIENIELNLISSLKGLTDVMGKIYDRLIDVKTGPLQGVGGPGGTMAMPDVRGAGGQRTQAPLPPSTPRPSPSVKAPPTAFDRLPPAEQKRQRDQARQDAEDWQKMTPQQRMNQAIGKVSMRMTPGKKYAALMPPDIEPSTFAAPPEGFSSVPKPPRPVGHMRAPETSYTVPSGFGQAPRSILPVPKPPTVPAGARVTGGQQNPIIHVPNVYDPSRNFRRDRNMDDRTTLDDTNAILMQVVKLLADGNRHIRGSQRAQNAAPARARYFDLPGSNERYNNERGYLYDQRLRMGAL